MAASDRSNKKSRDLPPRLLELQQGTLVAMVELLNSKLVVAAALPLEEADPSKEPPSQCMINRP